MSVRDGAIPCKFWTELGTKDYPLMALKIKNFRNFGCHLLEMENVVYLENRNR